MTAIIDYGMGNVGSIKNMLYKLGHEAVITSSIDEIIKARKIILPGVGAFDNAVKNLKDFGLFDFLIKKVLFDKTPILGICLGMQLMTKRSEEGVLPGLNLVDAETVRFEFNITEQKLKIPHMGWNQVKPMRYSPLNEYLLTDTKFYFVHSYYIKCNDSKDVLLTTDYGINFCSSFQKENILGVQFHPEKSHKYGLSLMKYFIEKF